MNESIHKFSQIGLIQWMSRPNRDVVRTLRQHIAHLHIGNAVKSEGLWLTAILTLALGFRIVKTTLLSLLISFAYVSDEGFFSEDEPYVFSFEVKPRYDEDDAIIIANSKRVIKRACAIV